MRGSQEILVETRKGRKPTIGVPSSRGVLGDTGKHSGKSLSYLPALRDEKVDVFICPHLTSCCMKAMSGVINSLAA